jgi:hypothetical protein
MSEEHECTAALTAVASYLFANSHLFCRIGNELPSIEEVRRRSGVTSILANELMALASEARHRLVAIDEFRAIKDQLLANGTYATHRLIADAEHAIHRASKSMALAA